MQKGDKNIMIVYVQIAIEAQKRLKLLLSKDLKTETSSLPPPKKKDE